MNKQMMGMPQAKMQAMAAGKENMVPAKKAKAKPTPMMKGGMPPPMAKKMGK